MEFGTKYGILVKYMENMGSALIAFSGGVDSSLLLAAALDALGRESVLAVTADSVIHPPEDLEVARKIAKHLGSPWQVVLSTEMDDPAFVANPPHRCYHCKRGLLALLAEVAEKNKLQCIVEGSNRDDLKDIRPGFRAVREAGVLSPLLEVGMSKGDVREAARARGIPNWNRPSDACLCSRVPYGVAITPQILNRIYKAEAVVRSLGVGTVRVRDHGDIARLEVPSRDIDLICRGDNRDIMAESLTRLGYRYVTVDITGYRTGSMNRQE